MGHAKRIIRLLTIKEVALMTNLSESTIRRASANNENDFPPFVKRGKATRWHEESIKLWLNIQDEPNSKWLKRVGNIA